MSYVQLAADITVRTRAAHLVALLCGGARHLARLCFSFNGDAVGVHGQHIMHQWLVCPYMLQHLYADMAIVKENRQLFHFCCIMYAFEFCFDDDNQ